MSAEATGWVWKHSPYKGSSTTRFLIHLAIADVVNDTHGNQFWMSNQSLAEKVGSDRAEVNRTLHDMVERGMLRVVYAEHGRTVIYEFLFEEGGVRTAHRGVCAERTGGVRTAHTELKGTQEEPKTDPHASENEPPAPLVLVTPDGATDPLMEEFNEFWKHYPRKVGRQDALKAWKSLAKGKRKAAREALFDEIAAGSRAWNLYWRKQRTEREFIPHAATWLRQERFREDPFDGQRKA